jgi:hypothetical protein
MGVPIDPSPTVFFTKRYGSSTRARPTPLPRASGCTNRSSRYQRSGGSMCGGEGRNWRSQRASPPLGSQEGIPSAGQAPDATRLRCQSRLRYHRRAGAVPVPERELRLVIIGLRGVDNQLGGHGQPASSHRARYACQRALQSAPLPGARRLTPMASAGPAQSSFVYAPQNCWCFDH